MSARSSPGIKQRQFRDAIIASLGPKALDTSQINKIGRHEFGRAWKGAKPQDKIKPKPNSFYIINTDVSGKPGQHWLGGITTEAKDKDEGAYLRWLEL